MPIRALHTRSTIPPAVAEENRQKRGIKVQKSVTAIVGCLLLLASSTAGCSRKPARSNDSIAPAHSATVCKDAPYHGIDVSSHQKDIDWNKLSTDSNIHFVYIKATEGSTYRSPHYARNLTEARRHGILVGSYHFLRSTSAIASQFRNFTATARRRSQDLIPMIDVETRGSWSRKQLIDSLQLLAELIERHYGSKPMIYSTMSFFNRNLSPYFNGYPLYIGRYSEKTPEISWNGHYTIWQYSETGKIAGIDTDVDLCRFSPSHTLADIMLPSATAK